MKLTAELKINFKNENYDLIETMNFECMEKIVNFKNAFDLEVLNGEDNCFDIEANQFGFWIHFNKCTVSFYELHKNEYFIKISTYGNATRKEFDEFVDFFVE